jgi:predicted transcriptional regulator
MKCNPENIGEFISSTREGMGVTQKNLTMTSGTGLRFIVDLEKGKLIQSLAHRHFRHRHAAIWKRVKFKTPVQTMKNTLN